MNKVLTLTIIFILQLMNLRTISADPKTIKIGGAFALTGTAKSFGVAEMNSAQIAIDEFNKENEGKFKAEILIEDTTSSNAKSLTAVSKLINLHGIKHIIGPTWLDSFSSVLPLSKQKNILLFSPSASMEALEGNPLFHDLVFSTYFSSEREIGGVLDFLKKENKLQICTFMQEDPYILMANKLAQQRAKQIGIEIKQEFLPSAEATDFKPELTKLKNADCESVFYIVAGEIQTFNFLKVFKELNINKKLYTYSGAEAYVNNPIFKDIIEGSFFVIPEKHTESFNTEYEKRFGLKPENIASNAYDAVKILLNTLKSGIVEPAKVAEHFRANFFDTITFGKAKFTKRGDLNAGEFRMHQVVDGVGVLVE